MRICFTSDLHGLQRLYAELDALLRRERPSLLILGGDMFPDGSLHDPQGTQVRYVREQFIPRVRSWREEFAGMRIACILGNHDWLCTSDAIQVHGDAGLLTLLSHERPWDVDGVSFLGFSRTPPTPYWVKDFERLDLATDEPPEMAGAVWDREAGCVRPIEPESYFRSAEAIADTLAQAPAPRAPWILVAHSPPYASALDRLPHLHTPVGSRAIRTFIEQRGPLCALHGHIHESPEVTGRFADVIGRTLCVNPGQGPRLHAVTFDTDDPADTLAHTVLP